MLERISRVDFLVFLEEAQYTRKTRQSWTTLGGSSGPFRLSFPVHGARIPTHSVTAAITSGNWFQKTCRTFQITYGQFASYRALKDELEGLLFEISRCNFLNEVGYRTMHWLISQAGLRSKMVKSRDLVESRPDDATEWMASFAPGLHATDYMQGHQAMLSYFRSGPFEKKGIRLWYQDYSPPQGKKDFPFPVTISALDPLLRGGSTLLRELIYAEKGWGDIGTVKRWFHS